METKPWFGFSAQPLAQGFDGALVDLDGVVYWGRNPVEGAGEALHAAAQQGMGVTFVTNNASRTPREVIDHLSALGIDGYSLESVVTAAQACADAMARELPAGATVLVVGGSGLREALTHVGLVPTDTATTHPIAVVQGYSAEVGWPILAEASYAIRAGATFYATNLDLTLPTERGQAPGNGALVAAVSAATGVQPISTGKPSPVIYRFAMDRAGYRNPLGVGDRLDTDIAGARNTGIPSLHVLTGVHGVADLAAAEPPQRPTFVAAGLEGLLQPHPPVARQGDVMACRKARASYSGGQWRLSNPPGSPALDLVRAAVAECWRHLDAGDPSAGATLPHLATAGSAGS